MGLLKQGKFWLVLGIIAVTVFFLLSVHPLTGSHKDLVVRPEPVTIRIIVSGSDPRAQVLNQTANLSDTELENYIHERWLFVMGRNGLTITTAECLWQVVLEHYTARDLTNFMLDDVLGEKINAISADLNVCPYQGL